MSTPPIRKRQRDGEFDYIAPSKKGLVVAGEYNVYPDQLECVSIENDILLVGGDDEYYYVDLNDSSRVIRGELGKKQYCRFLKWLDGNNGYFFVLSSDTKDSQDATLSVYCPGSNMNNCQWSHISYDSTISLKEDIYVSMLNVNGAENTQNVILLSTGNMFFYVYIDRLDEKGRGNIIFGGIANAPIRKIEWLSDNLFIIMTNDGHLDIRYLDPDTYFTRPSLFSPLQQILDEHPTAIDITYSPERDLLAILGSDKLSIYNTIMDTSNSLLLISRPLDFNVVDDIQMFWSYNNSLVLWNSMAYIVYDDITAPSTDQYNHFTFNHKINYDYFRMIGSPNSKYVCLVMGTSGKGIITYVTL